MNLYQCAAQEKKRSGEIDLRLHRRKMLNKIHKQKSTKHLTDDDDSNDNEGSEVTEKPELRTAGEIDGDEQYYEEETRGVPPRDGNDARIWRFPDKGCCEWLQQVLTDDPADNTFGHSHFLELVSE